MKTLRQYETQIKDESLNLEDYINESRIDEGFLSVLKEFIKNGISLYEKMFKYSKKAGSDVLKFYKQKAKDKADNNTLKNFLSGREFWDNWFAKSKWETQWLKINPKTAKNESLENNIKLITEYTSSEEKEINKQKRDAAQAESDSKKQADFALFSEEKYEKYAKYEGMIDIIIAGFTFVYDLAKSKNDKKALELVSSNIKNALKDKSVSDEQKSHLKEAINDVKDASEKNNKDNEESPSVDKETIDSTAQKAADINKVQSDTLSSFVKSIFGIKESQSEKYLIERSNQNKRINQIISKTKSDGKVPENVLIEFGNVFGALAQICKITKVNPGQLGSFISDVLNGAIDGVDVKKFNELVDSAK